MSNIAYVSDETMLEYHRLCRNKEILFWRLSSKHRFTDFQVHDLLFFYTNSPFFKQKVIVGYGRFQGYARLSLNQMWVEYGQKTGFDSKQRLISALHSKVEKIPSQMACLKLDHVVFFGHPIDLDSLGFMVSQHLESYCYLDKEDTRFSLKILEKAKEYGIDFWSDQDDFDIIQEDMERLEMIDALKDILPSSLSKIQRRLLRPLQQRLYSQGFQPLMANCPWCFKVEDQHRYIGIPFGYTTQQYQIELQKLAGLLLLCKINLQQPCTFVVETDQRNEQIERLVNTINHEYI